MSVPRVSNIKNDNGNDVPNQFVIKTGQYHFFQSYETVIARVCRPTGQVCVDINYWNRSATTSKHRNKFLGLTTNEVKAGINSGEIKLTDLN